MPVMRLQLAVRDTLIDPLVWHLMWAWNLGELQRLGDGHPWFRGWIARQRRLRKEEEGRGRSQHASLPAELPELPPELLRPKLSTVWKFKSRGASRSTAQQVVRARLVAQRDREAQGRRKQEKLRSAFEWLRSWTPEHRYLLAFFRLVKREVLALRWAADWHKQLEADFLAESKEPAYPLPQPPKEPQQPVALDLKRLDMKRVAQYFAVDDRAPTAEDLAAAVLVPLDAGLLADCAALTTKLAALSEQLRRAVPSLPTELGDGFAVKLWDRQQRLTRALRDLRRNTQLMPLHSYVAEAFGWRRGAARLTVVVNGRQLRLNLALFPNRTKSWQAVVSSYWTTLRSHQAEVELLGAVRAYQSTTRPELQPRELALLLRYLPDTEARLRALGALAGGRLVVRHVVPNPEVGHEVGLRAWEKLTLIVKRVRRYGVPEQLVYDDETRRSFVCEVPGASWVFTVPAVYPGQPNVDQGRLTMAVLDLALTPGQRSLLYAPPPAPTAVFAVTRPPPQPAPRLPREGRPRTRPPTRAHPRPHEDKLTWEGQRRLQ